jgi:hypothetical protein
MKVLETQDNKIDLLARNITDSSAKALGDYINLNISGVINSVTKYYYDKGFKLDSWVDFYNEVDVSEFAKYNKIFIMSGMDLQGAGLNRQQKRVGSFPNDDGNIGFVSTGRQACNIVAILKAHKLYGTEIHELSYDPNELCLNLMHTDYKPLNNYYNYHGYDIPRYNMKRLDSLQYHFEHTRNLFPEDKCYDITFGYTSMRGERTKFEDFIEQTYSNFTTKNLYVRDKKKDINTLVDKDLYLQKLEQSRYTIIVPSYNETCFSIYRLIEALHNDCLPIISPTCRVDELETSFGISLEPLINHPSYTEHTRLELLEYYKNIFLTFETNFVTKL